jgi:hypothetical protein
MVCKRGTSFEDCELAILRMAVDKVDKREGSMMLKKPQVKEIIKIVEQFIIKNHLVCYGGTAINALLPPDDQFYDMTVELPDYDFFSPDALKHAKELADIYYKKGFTNVEAKSGVHAGTFKVFVDFIPVADITQVVPELFKAIKKTSIAVRGINYCSPNYLRMLMYLELSRPKGDASRWEKVLKRISLLNKNYPLRGKHCDFIEIQRFFDPEQKLPDGKRDIIFYTTRDSLINQGVVFFGAMALQMYLRYHKKFKYQKFEKIPDFDVLAKDPKQTAEILKARLKREGIKKVSIRERKGVGEVIAPHYEVVVNKETIVIIYKPLACHSYNEIRIKKRKVKIATIDTMLSLYLAFMYVNRKYYDPNRILCMSEFLFKIQQFNRLAQKGLLKRFSINCYGNQETLDKMREEKAHMFEKLKHKRNSKEWDYYFLKYLPGKNDHKNKTKKHKYSSKKGRKRRRKTRRKRRRKTRLGKLFGL